MPKSAICSQKNTTSARICILTSGHSPFDGRVYDREINTLLMDYGDITIIAPARAPFRQPARGLKVITFDPRRNDKLARRLRPLAALLRLALAQRADLYHCHEPDSLLVGLLCKWVRGGRVLYDAHEYHPEQMAARAPRALRGAVQRAVACLERRLASRADAVVTVNEDLVRRYSTWGAKSFLVPNYPLTTQWSVPRRRSSHHKDVVGVFVGGLTTRQGLSQLIAGLGRIRASHPHVRLRLVGPAERGARELLRDWAERHGVADRVEITAPVPHEEVPSILADADFGLVVDCFYERGHGSVATKTFEYMAAGLPILVDNLTAAHRLVEAHAIGVSVDPSNPDSIASGLRRLADDDDVRAQMGRRGRQAFLAKYNWETAARELRAAYDVALDGVAPVGRGGGVDREHHQGESPANAGVRP
jgi:glycosyltransferase involved in cell wall biosynthesis